MIMNYVGIEIYHKNKLKGKTTINIRVLALKNVEKKVAEIFIVINSSSTHPVQIWFTPEEC